jgi:hypothetical protein
MLCTIQKVLIMGDLKLLSTVALLEELPQTGLVRGQMGTIVENLGSGIYEVEFSDQTGRAYALVALRASQLLELRREPSLQMV